MPTLVVAYPGPLAIDPDGTMILDDKMHTGLAAYQALWPGDVVLAAPQTDVMQHSVGTGRFRVDELPFRVELAPRWLDAVQRSEPDLVLAPLTSRTTQLASVLEKSVLVAENTPEEITRTEAEATAHRRDRLRVAIGGIRRRHVFSRMLARSRGVQCNGYVARARYGTLAPTALLYFDTRLTDEHLALARAVERAAPGHPPRLCFSGRFVEIKGPDFAVATSNILAASGYEHELVMVGGGALEEKLRTSAGPSVRFVRGMRFADEWTSYIRENMDLMLLPHVQADPSGTYLEAAGCGVPLVGFDNKTLSALVADGRLGWTAPMRDPEGLAHLVQDVVGDPLSWRAARQGALDFMSKHTFEKEFATRVQHLKAVL